MPPTGNLGETVSSKTDGLLVKTGHPVRARHTHGEMDAISPLEPIFGEHPFASEIRCLESVIHPRGNATHIQPRFAEVEGMTSLLEGQGPRPCSSPAPLIDAVTSVKLV